MERVTRRCVLVLVLAFAVALAGCAGGGTPTAPPDDADEGGGDAGGDGGDAGDGDDSDDGGDGGEQSGADGADGTPTATSGGSGGSASTATPSPTAAGTPTPSPTPNATGPATDRLPTLGEVIEPADSFRYRFDISELDGEPVDMHQEGRYHEGDIYAQITSEGQTTEMYIVDGQGYIVGEGVCQQAPTGSAQNPGNTTQADSWANESLRPSETTTLDGQEVYVYESESAVPGFEGPTTIYVSVESGHVVRQESPDLVSETWDFGNVDPVEAPC